VVKARCAMSWIGVREFGYSGTDVARHLGVTNSCVTRMIPTGKKQDIVIFPYKNESKPSLTTFHKYAFYN
jgi:hypothetical protein